MDEVGTVLRHCAESTSISLSARQHIALTRYATLVLKWQRVTNLTGASTAVQFAREHIADCFALIPYLCSGTLLDVGSGAGLPGLVVAIMRPEMRITLLEPRARRARFLTQARIETDLNNVEVQQTRIEQYRATRRFDYVVARALSSLQGFVRLALSYRAEATLVAMKASIDPADLDSAQTLWGTAAQVVPIKVAGFRERNLVFFRSATQLFQGDGESRNGINNAAG